MSSPSSFITRMNVECLTSFSQFAHHHHHQQQHPLETHSLLWYHPYLCFDFVPNQSVPTIDNSSSKKRKVHPFDQKPSSSYTSMDQQAPPVKKSRPSSSRTQSSQHQRQPQHEPPLPPQPTFQLSYEDVSLRSLEEDLQHLQDEYATIEIILNSLRNAYPIRPIDNASEELLDEMDRELSVAYDDVKAQVRQLARSINRLEEEIVLFLPRTPIPTGSSMSTDPAAVIDTTIPQHSDRNNDNEDDEPPLPTSMG